jgi:segregation and condensation protein B
VTDDQEHRAEEFGLEAFGDSPPDDQGVSLEELAKAYASLLDRGDDPYLAVPDTETPAGIAAVADEAVDEEEPQPPEDEQAVCDISPRSILEAMLFVGHPENEALTSEKIASYMRGVRSQEIDDLIVELNRTYTQEGCPYRIESVGAGYRMALRDEFNSLRAKFYGRAKAAKLSQAAIDVLAIVAYKQPMTREDVDELRGRPSGSLLTQLVRRGLLRMERPHEKPRTPRYSTTDRFLELFALDSIQDLPQSPD